MKWFYLNSIVILIVMIAAIVFMMAICEIGMTTVIEHFNSAVN